MKKGKLKNIVIINDFDYVQGGASKVAVETANLLSNDYNVIFFSAASNENSSLNDNVTKVCTNQGEALKNKNKFKGFINGIYNFKAKRELKKLLLTLNKDETIIHVHGWTKCLSSSVFDIAWKLGFKVVLTMHDYFVACPNGGYFNYKKNEICHLKPLSCKCCRCNCDSRNYFFKIYRIIRQFVQNKIVGLNKKLDYAISVSDFSQNVLKESFNKNIKIIKIYNPIKFYNTQTKIDLKNNKYYLYVGRLSKEKGVDIFCQAIEELNFKGVVVGDGPELTNLKNNYPKIDFVGWKTQEEVFKYMREAKALIFPSRLYETMGLTILEAGLIGLPIYISKNTAGTEFVSDKEFLFEGIDDLKKKIKKQSQFKGLSVNKNNFSYENYIKLLNKTYLEMLR